MFRTMLKIVLHADNFELLAQRVHAEAGQAGKFVIDFADDDPVPIHFAKFT